MTLVEEMTLPINWSLSVNLTYYRKYWKKEQEVTNIKLPCSWCYPWERNLSLCHYCEAVSRLWFQTLSYRWGINMAMRQVYVQVNIQISLGYNTLQLPNFWKLKPETRMRRNVNLMLPFRIYGTKSLWVILRRSTKVDRNGVKLNILDGPAYWDIASLTG